MKGIAKAEAARKAEVQGRKVADLITKIASLDRPENEEQSAEQEKMMAQLKEEEALLEELSAEMRAAL